jgi:hypothetical protein
MTKTQRRLGINFITSFICFILFTLGVTFTSNGVVAILGLIGFFITFIMWLGYLTLLLKDVGVI